ncbi:uncharacterized [Tachysurus ichikawai]
MGFLMGAKSQRGGGSCALAEVQDFRTGERGGEKGESGGEKRGRVCECLAFTPLSSSHGLHGHGIPQCNSLTRFSEGETHQN